MAKDDKKMSEAERAQLQFDRESKIFGFSTNKFGAVKIMNLHRYKKMDKNRDLIGDEYDRSEKFVEISEKDNSILTRAARDGNDEKLQAEALKIKTKYVSKLDIFMDFLRQGKVSDEATTLSEDLLDALKKVKTSAPAAANDSAVRAREAALNEAEQKLADEKQALEDEKALFLQEKEAAAKTTATTEKEDKKTK